jgi:TolA-binding protein
VKFLKSGGLLALALVAALARPAAAQSVTNADIQRLQDNIYDASRDVSQVRSRDAQLASQLQTELDDLRDETIYLKVKLRKNEPVARTEYSDLRDRIDNVRSRARGDSTSRSVAPIAPVPDENGRTAAAPPATSGTAARPPASGTATRQSGSGTATRDSTADVPVGTEFDVRLQQSLSSATNQVEDRFEATTMVDLREGDRVIVPAGSIMRGVVSSVNKAGRIERKGSLTVAFDQVTVNGRNYPIRATVTQAIESEGVRGEVGKIGTGAGVGAIIGGILGGFKGAMAGILIGGGGTIAATEGKDVDLPAGTVLRVRLDSGLSLR